MKMLDVSHVRVISARPGIIFWLPAVFFFAGFAHSATIVDNTTLNIDSSTAPTDYLVRKKGVLNASDANTRSITAQSGSSLSINGSTIVGNDGGEGVTVTSSRASIDRTTVTSDDIGLAVNRSSVAAGGSTATVSNSQISGQLIGSQVTGLSSLSLTNTQITGAASDGIGVNILGGEVSASAGTSITGQATGVRMVNDALNVGSRTLLLDNSTVQGIAGSAILVDRGTEATINVFNGSSLLAGNGRLLDVQGTSIASLTVANSTLNGNVHVSDNSTANLVFDQGEITGDVLVDGSSTANVTLENNSQLTGRLDNVDSVNVNSNSNWTLTGNDSIGALGMNGATVTFGAATDAPGTYYTLNVGSLSGNGTFAMKGDFASGERDFLNVAGASSGDFALAVAASGLDAASPQQLSLVRTGTTDAANFALAGEQRVDVGTWSYGLASREIEGGAKEWYLDPTTEVVSPGARSVLALFNTAPTVWYGELASLRDRMGDLRLNAGKAGAWSRAYGSKYNVADGSGVGYQQTQQGFSLGADARVGESDVLIGILAGTSESDLDLNRGTSGTVKSYYVAPYVTWLGDDGYYAHGTFKWNRFRNESKVNLSDGTRAKGDYDNWGVGGSAEFGRQIKLADGYFIEPFTQWSAVQIQGKRYTLDNDMEADGDRMRSLLGKAGATVGRNIGFGHGAIAQPYLRAAIVHEFASNNEVKVNNNVFNNDLSGSRAEFGAGVAVAMSEKWQVHAGFDYSKGEHIEQPYGANVGLTVRW